MYISPYCRLVLVPPNVMKFGVRGQLTDVITCVKFLVNRFRGYGVLTPPKLPFPIDFLRHPYNSVRTAVRHCDDTSICTSMCTEPPQASPTRVEGHGAPSEKSTHHLVTIETLFQCHNIQAYVGVNNNLGHQCLQPLHCGACLTVKT